MENKNIEKITFSIKKENLIPKTQTFISTSKNINLNNHKIKVSAEFTSSKKFKIQST
jgi:hypothetical protein